ncbi:DUF2442 domain-containing protein [uncultured Thiodictyon sp.]|uniref:DUF2442 domain-containing protein n=1 Tax=uncultured Thiodictyon sp. TaxID=1846217 RepID=UPI0025E89AEF|nr:DUF2442 domain-containing protein [uncultured Thiodictyon sp.]
MSRYFFPQLEEVHALEPYRLRTRWSTGETLEVEVGDKLRSIPALAPILAPEVFATAHLAEWGGSVEWFDTEFGADNLYAWSKEQAGLPSHEQFDAWMRRNGLSLTTAAEALGLSRRMVSYYRTAQRPIPKTVWLACLGWEYLRLRTA